MKKPLLHYINYLSLDKILDIQHPVSGDDKTAAHEENALYYYSPNLHRLLV